MPAALQGLPGCYSPLSALPALAHGSWGHWPVADGLGGHCCAAQAVALLSAGSVLAGPGWFNLRWQSHLQGPAESQLHVQGL